MVFRVVFLVILAIAAFGVFELWSYLRQPQSYRPPWEGGVRTVDGLPDGGVRATVERDGLLYSMELTRTVMFVGEDLGVDLSVRNVSDESKTLPAFATGWEVPSSATAGGYFVGCVAGMPYGRELPDVTLRPGEETSTVMFDRHDKPSHFRMAGMWHAWGGNGLWAQTDPVKVCWVDAEELEDPDMPTPASWMTAEASDGDLMLRIETPPEWAMYEEIPVRLVLRNEGDEPVSFAHHATEIREVEDEKTGLLGWGVGDMHGLQVRPKPLTLAPGESAVAVKEFVPYHLLYPLRDASGPRDVTIVGRWALYSESSPSTEESMTMLMTPPIQAYAR